MAQAFVDVANLKAKEDGIKTSSADLNLTDNTDDGSNGLKRKLSLEPYDTFSLASKNIDRINSAFEDLEMTIKSSETCLNQIKILKHEVSNKLRSFVLYVMNKEFEENGSITKTQKMSSKKDEDCEMVSDTVVPPLRNTVDVEANIYTPFQVKILQALQQPVPNEINFDEAFLVSLLPFIQKMNDEQKIDIRLQFMQVIEKISKSNSAPSTTHQHNPPTTTVRQTSAPSTTRCTTSTTSSRSSTPTTTPQSSTSTTTPQRTTAKTFSQLTTITVVTSSQCTTATTTTSQRSTTSTTSQCTTSTTTPQRTTATTSSQHTTVTNTSLSNPNPIKVNPSNSVNPSSQPSSHFSSSQQNPRRYSSPYNQRSRPPYYSNRYS